MDCNQSQCQREPFTVVSHHHGAATSIRITFQALVQDSDQWAQTRGGFNSIMNPKHVVYFSLDQVEGPILICVSLSNITGMQMSVLWFCYRWCGCKGYYVVDRGQFDQEVQCLGEPFNIEQVVAPELPTHGQPTQTNPNAPTSPFPRQPTPPNTNVFTPFFPFPGQPSLTNTNRFTQGQLFLGQPTRPNTNSPTQNFLQTLSSDVNQGGYNPYFSRNYFPLQGNGFQQYPGNNFPARFGNFPGRFFK